MNKYNNLVSGFTTLEALMTLLIIGGISAFTVQLSIDAENAVYDYQSIQQKHFEQYQKLQGVKNAD